MTTWIPLALASILAIAAEGEADKGRGAQQRGPQDISGFIDKVIEAVDATDEQKTQLAAIADEHNQAAAAAREKSAALTEEQRAEVRELHREARAARRSGDEAQAEKLESQLEELSGRTPGELMKTTHEKISDVLTAEQRPLFEELVRSQRDARGRGGSRGGPGGFGDRGDRGGRGEGMMLQRFIDRVVEDVDATDEQQEQLKQISDELAAEAKANREKAQANREANREKLQALHEDLREAMENDDEEAVADLRKQVQELMGTPQRGAQFEVAFERIGKVLTEEQKPAYEALVAEMKERLAAGPGSFEGPRERGRGGRESGRGHDDETRNPDDLPDPKRDAADAEDD